MTYLVGGVNYELGDAPVFDKEEMAFWKWVVDKLVVSLFMHLYH